VTIRLAALVICTAACVATVHGQHGNVSIYVDVSPRSCSANAAALVLTVDGTRVPVVNAIPAPQPLSTVALFDRSGSVLQMPIENPLKIPFEQTARGLVRAIRKGDNVRLGTIGSKVLFSSTNLTDEGTAIKAAREVSQASQRTLSGEPSPIWDALYESFGVARGSPGLPSVIIFTDGMPTASDRRFDDVQAEALRRHAVVSAVVAGDKVLPPSRVQIHGRTEAMRRLVEETGGDYRELDRRTDTPAFVFNVLLNNLRERCRLDFVPPVVDDVEHRISVTLGGRPVRAPARLRF
jgi:hypothetical protein